MLLPAAAAVAALIATFAQTSGPAEPVPIDGLPGLVTADDYPREALVKNEEGSVSYQLAIDAEGKVAGCTITGSSGSVALDSVTCRIMQQRARFHPARDAAGLPVAGEVTQRIHWRLTDKGTTPRGSAALMLWTNCAIGEAAKLALTELSTDAIAARAFQPCAELEALAARETGLEMPLEMHREFVGGIIENGLAEARSTLNDSDDER